MANNTRIFTFCNRRDAKPRGFEGKREDIDSGTSVGEAAGARQLIS